MALKALFMEPNVGLYVCVLLSGQNSEHSYGFSYMQIERMGFGRPQLEWRAQGNLS